MNTRILLQIPNAASIGDDGWAQLAPLGEFAGVAFTNGQPKAAVQIVNREAGEALIRSVKSLGGKAARFFRSIPIYNGHPDAPALAGAYPDSEPKGTLGDIQLREDGIYIRPVLNEAGAELVNGGIPLGLSAYVDATILEETDQRIVAQWSRLRSVGLTPEPNLPVRLLNARAAAPGQLNPEETNMSLPIVIAALSAVGVQIANGASDDAVVSSIRQLANERTTATQLAAARETEIAQLRARVTELSNAVTERDTRLAAAETERITELLNERVASGAIPESDRKLWEPRLKANFALESNALRGLKGALKTTSDLANSGGRRGSTEGDTGTAEHYSEAVRAAVKSGKKTAEAVTATIAQFPNSYAAWRAAGCPAIPEI